MKLGKIASLFLFVLFFTACGKSELNQDDTTNTNEQENIEQESNEQENSEQETNKQEDNNQTQNEQGDHEQENNTEDSEIVLRNVVWGMTMDQVKEAKLAEGNEPIETSDSSLTYEITVFDQQATIYYSFKSGHILVMDLWMQYQYDVRKKIKEFVQNSYDVEVSYQDIVLDIEIPITQDTTDNVDYSSALDDLSVEERGAIIEQYNSYRSETSEFANKYGTDLQQSAYTVEEPFLISIMMSFKDKYSEEEERIIIENLISEYGDVYQSNKWLDEDSYYDEIWVSDNSVINYFSPPLEGVPAKIDYLPQYETLVNVLEE